MGRQLWQDVRRQAEADRGLYDWQAEDRGEYGEGDEAGEADGSDAEERIPYKRPTTTPCPSTRAFSSTSPEYTEVTQVLDRIRRGVTSPKIAKKVDAIFVFNVEGEGKFHVDLKIGNEVSVGAGEPAGKADVTATLSKEVFLQIFNRQLKPANAFMSGQVKLSGDLSKMISFENVIKASRDD